MPLFLVRDIKKSRSEGLVQDKQCISRLTFRGKEL